MSLTTMKRVLKLALTGILIAFAATALWCSAFPLLFPAYFQAGQAEFQQWLAEHPIPSKSRRTIGSIQPPFTPALQAKPQGRRWMSRVVGRSQVP